MARLHFYNPVKRSYRVLQRPGALTDFKSSGKLRLVRPKDYLGYFSIMHVTLRRRLILLAKLMEVFTDAAP